MGWYGARFSPLPRSTPSWKASHIPSRVVHVMQRWCHFPSLMRNGSFANWRKEYFMSAAFFPSVNNLHFVLTDPHLLYPTLNHSLYHISFPYQKVASISYIIQVISFFCFSSKHKYFRLF